MKKKKSLKQTHPQLVLEWDYEKNTDITPEKVTYGSDEKIWWKCAKGHSYKARIGNRVFGGTGCPYCSNNKILQGYNDLQTTDPELAKEWHPTKNGNLKPSDVFKGGKYKYWWICSEGHSFQKRLYEKKLGNGCPYCSSKKIKIGFNDLASKYPELVSEWNTEKNELKPTDFSVGSNKKVWWKCREGHEWESTIYSRTLGKTSCQECRKIEKQQIKKNRKRIYKVKITRKRKINENLLNEWNYNKNIGIDPLDLKIPKMTKVWWSCEKGHEWKTSISSREKGSKCYICTEYKIMKGYTDLLTLMPEMKKQWDFEKNNNVDIYTVGPKSKKTVWWKCDGGHRWKETIVSRCKNKVCMYCYNMHATSFPEQAFYYYIKRNFPEAINRYQLEGKYEVDIYIPKLKIGIEYDGIYYHSGKSAQEKELKKEKIIEEKNIFLIRIKEHRKENRIERYEKKICFYYKIKNNSELSEIIDIVLKYLQIENEKVDVENDMYKILNSYQKNLYEKSVVKLMPEKVKEWNYEKNAPLTPDKIYANSSKKVWWKCEKGHEWKISPSKRYTLHTNCPYCANKKVQKGYNDLATINPKLAKQWHPTKNRELKPTQFTFCSGKKVWWICEKRT